MRAQSLYEYFIIRVVPFVEREEFINAGVCLLCKELQFLQIQIDINLTRLPALAPKSDYKSIPDHLHTMQKIAKGGIDAGFFNKLSLSERFNWLAAKSSTVIQTSSIHCGLTSNPQDTLDNLFKKMVL